MIKIPLGDAEWSSLEADDQLDCVCDWFEQTLRLGQRPSASDYAELLIPEYREELLQELMLLEQSYEDAASRSSEQELSATVSMRSSRADTDFELRHRKVTEIDEQTKARFPVPFGKYILTADLGNGSFGDVFLAKHIESGVNRAIKVPRPQLLSEKDDIQRFQREVQNACRLDHEGIVKFYDHGRYGSTPFLVSEYVAGKTLKEVLTKFGRLPIRTAARLIADLARAVHYAHEKKIIHRDLKPSNVMIAYPVGANEIDPKAERLVPKLLDFGISKRINSNSMGTLPGEILGTPAYMSPEQASGESSKVTPLSDVYSLGAILFELLVARTPFIGDASVISHCIQNQEVPSIGRIDPSVDRKIATICHKALKLDAAHRFGSALEMAEDLERWLNDQPILAKPTGLLERSYLWTKRNPTDLKWGLAATGLLLGVTALGLKVMLTPTPTLRSIVMNDGIVSHTVRNEIPIEEWLSQLPQSLSQPQLLWERLEKGVSPQQITILGEALRPHAKTCLPLMEAKLTEYEGNLSTSGMLASVLGVVSPDSLKRIDASKSLIQWLVRSEFSGDMRGWIGLTRRFRDPLLEPLVSHYQSSESISERKLTLDYLLELLDQNTIEIGLAGAADANVNDLVRWKKEFAPYQNAVVPILREQLESAGLQYSRDDRGEKIAKRTGNLRLIAYGFGDYEAVWPALGVVTDPRPRSYFAHQIVDTGFPLYPLVDRLVVETDPTIQYSLLLSLSQAKRETLEPDATKAFQQWVANAYSKNPDGGVHSMCRWFLKNWGRVTEVNEMDLQLAKEGIVSGREWYVNSIGMTMRIFRGPVELLLPPITHKANQDLPTVATWERDSIPYSFAIATEKVNPTTFCLFDSIYRRDEQTIVSDDVFCDTQKVTWNQAIQFSHWLTNREGLAKNGETAIRWMNSDELKGKVSSEVNLSLPGYRLPTRREWHISFRGSIETESFYGTFLTPHNSAYGPNLPTENKSKTITKENFLPNRCGIFSQIDDGSEWLFCKYNIGKDDGFGGAANLVQSFPENFANYVIHGSLVSRAGSLRFKQTTSMPNNELKPFSFRISQSLCD